MNRVALRALAAGRVGNMTEHIPVLLRFVDVCNANTTRNNHTETDTNKAKFNITGKIFQAVQATNMDRVGKQWTIFDDALYAL